MFCRRLFPYEPSMLHRKRELGLTTSCTLHAPRSAAFIRSAFAQKGPRFKLALSHEVDLDCNAKGPFIFRFPLTSYAQLR